MEGKPHRKRQQRKGEHGIAPAIMTERGLPNGSGTHRTNQRGQTLVEMGLTVSLCVLLTLGIVEFGYIFMALNLITQATSAGARAASVHQMGSRSLCGKITDKSAIVGAGTGTPGLVRSQISSIATVSEVKLDSRFLDCDQPLDRVGPCITCRRILQRGVEGGDGASVDLYVRLRIAVDDVIAGVQ